VFVTTSDRGFTAIQSEKGASAPFFMGHLPFHALYFDNHKLALYILATIKS
jgi:hypothetical protein